MDQTVEKLQTICRTRNGKRIYYDPEQSHAATHMAEYPQLYGLVKGILPDVVAVDASHIFDIDLGHRAGLMDLVETGPDDDIVFAKRRNRELYIPLVKHRRPTPTNFVSLILVQRPDGDYDLFTAWIGPQTPALPGSEYESADSRLFWSNHALIWGREPVQEDTVTRNCPW